MGASYFCKTRYWGHKKWNLLTTLNYAYLLRILAAAALSFTIPTLALFFFPTTPRQHSSLCLNSILLKGFFALSFGQRELLGFVLAQVLVATFSLGLLVTAFHSLNLPPQAQLQEWMGLGRKARAASLAIILTVASAAGIAPFFGSLLLQKTLSINSPFALFPLSEFGSRGILRGASKYFILSSNPSGNCWKSYFLRT